MFILSLMCLEKINFESRVRSRCLCSLTLSTIVPLKKKKWMSDFNLLLRK